MKRLLRNMQRNVFPRFLSCLLIAAIVSGGINPAGPVMAKEKFGDWDVSYSISLGDTDGIELGDENGEIVLTAEGGQHVFLRMQMIPTGDPGTQTFKEKFEISMPAMIYESLAEWNGDANEWFSEANAETGYGLELVDRKATDSNATGSNATDTHSASDAEDDRYEDTVTLTYQFNKDVRNGRGIDTAETEIETGEWELEFVLSGDALLTCVQQGNDCTLSAVFGGEMEETTLQAQVLEYMVTVTGVLPREVALVAEVVPAEDYLEELGLEDAVQALIALDIHLELKGYKYAVPESVNVAITGVEVTDMDAVTAYHISDDGDTEILPAIVSENGTVEFEAESFSVYVLVASAKPTVTGTHDQDGMKFTLYSDGTAKLTGLDSGITELNVPEQVTDTYNEIYQVVGIDKQERNSSLQTVTLPEGITEIPDEGFKNCPALTTVNGPGVVKVGHSAFLDCPELTAFTGSKVSFVGRNGFHGCEKLVEFDFTNVTEIGYSAFSPCRNLTGELLLPAIVSIDGYAFSEAAGLTKIVTGESLKAIGDGAFQWCGKLTDIQINAASNVSVGSATFYACTNLQHVQISDNITEISKSMFEYGYSLKEISGNGVKKIGDSAFARCVDLERVRFPNVTEIGKSAFGVADGWYPKVEHIDFPKLTTIGDKAFEGCKNLKTVSLPQVETIGIRAFNNCIALTELDLPELTKVSEETFQDCQSLRTVSIPKATAIDKKGFDRNYELAGIYMPVVETIGQSAFHTARKLEMVSLPSIKTIGPYAFQANANLTKVELGHHTTSLANQSFQYNGALEEFRINNWKEMVSLGSYVLYNSSITEADIIYLDAAGIDDKINSTDTLQDAVNEMAQGSRTEIFIENDVAVSTAITVPSGKPVVINSRGGDWTILNKGTKESMFIVKEEADFTLDGSLTFNGMNQAETVVDIEKGGKFTLKDGDITGAHYQAAAEAVHSAAVFAEAGSFHMLGGEIYGNTTNHNYCGAVTIRGNRGSALFRMEDGMIRNNTGKYGGGVNIYGNSTGQPSAILEMNGGEIKENTAVRGGGITSWRNVRIDLNGGKISNNTAVNYGGGIYSYESLILNIDNTAEISGNKVTAGNGGGISISGSDTGKSVAYFKMDGGEIKENTASGVGGGVYVSADINNYAEVIMTDGTIQGNTGKNGGGILFSTKVERDIEGNAPISFQLSGGSIIGNSAIGTAENDRSTGFGGGIEVEGAVSVTMSGGSIDSNFATRLGGGINYIKGDGHFTMTGGEITNNIVDNPYWGGSFYELGGTGGGLNFAGSMGRITGGMISGNDSYTHGGGIYITTGSTLYIEKALVTANMADHLGGGLWNCPRGYSGAHVNEGTAIIGNTAGSGTASGGDDFTQITKVEDSVVETYLIERMLGGGYVEWYEDGTMIPNDNENGNGDLAPDSVRFDINTSPRVSGSELRNIRKELLLKAVYTEDAAALAKSLAEVEITNNHSGRGGGIANNGVIIFGDSSAAEYNLVVEKEWADNVAEEKKTDVVIDLSLESGGNDYLLQTVTLTKDNSWKVEYDNIPSSLADAAAAKKLKVNEIKIDGLYAEYDISVNQNTNTITVKVRNMDAGVELKAHKILNGRELKDQEFTFRSELVYESNSTAVAVKEVKNDQKGNIRFSGYYLPQAGSYIFALSEVRGGDTTVSYTTKKYYAQVTVNENGSSEVIYGTGHDTTTHKVTGVLASGTIPVFENALEPIVPQPKYLNIKKVSKASNAPLVGAEFTLSYRITGSNDGWLAYGGTLISAGTDGLVSVKLPDEHWKYEYQLIETKAPAGYSKARVGTIVFTLSEDGTVKTISSSGTAGYVEVSDDRTTIIAKNHTTGGGGGGGTDPTKPTPTDPTKPTDPTTPTEETTVPVTTEPGVIPLPPGVDPNNPGDLPPGRYLVTIIGEDGVPLSYILDVPAPQGYLPKTGDDGNNVWPMLLMMAGAAGIFGVVLYLRRRKETEQ